MTVMLIWESDGGSIEVVRERLTQLFVEVVSPDAQWDAWSNGRVNALFTHGGTSCEPSMHWAEDGGRKFWSTDPPVTERGSEFKCELPARALHILNNWPHNGCWAPPFLVGVTGAQELHVATDWLGRSPLYELREDNFYAVSNRTAALMAVRRLELDEQAVLGRIALGWYAGHTAALEGVCRAPLGYRATFGTRTTDIQWSARGAEEFMRIGRRANAETVPRAVSGLAALLEDASSCAPCIDVGLSGGWDSRVIAAFLASARSKQVVFRVKGEERDPDVVLARRVAERLGIRLRHKSPSGSSAIVESGLASALTMACGGGFPSKLVGYRPRYFEPGRWTFSGLDAHLSRAYFARKLSSSHRRAWGQSQLATHLARFMQDEFCPSSVVEAGRRLSTAQVLRGIRTAWRISPGIRSLDAFYLMEGSRRFIADAASIYPNPMFTPYLAPSLVRGVFMSKRTWKKNEMHRAAIERLAPILAGVPTDKDVAIGHQGGKVVSPSLDGAEALVEVGLCSRIFDPRKFFRADGADAAHVLVVAGLEEMIRQQPL